MNGNKAAVQPLVEEGANMESKGTICRRTPVGWATANGRALVQPRLEKGADRTPLSCAAQKGHKAVVQLLLEKGADVESNDKNGWTPLHWAAVEGHEGVVKLLLEKGAGVDSEDQW